MCWRCGLQSEGAAPSAKGRTSRGSLCRQDKPIDQLLSYSLSLRNPDRASTYSEHSNLMCKCKASQFRCQPCQRAEDVEQMCYAQVKLPKLQSRRMQI